MIKVSWPTRSELWDATSVVIISTFILAVFVYIIDLLFAASVGLIIK
ncbi:MAG: preprotein translocase subunit SecE [Candidatus Omnitrophica bacterium]|nr:preprotein translocase subunit SecE [Candidatus Omnitrophota bacterium]